VVARSKPCCTDDYGPFVNISLLLLRLAAAILMLTHGVPKMGKLLAGDFSFPDPIGLGPEFSLTLAAFAEFFCSLLVLIGYRSRLAAIPLIITMLVALLVVHGNDSIFEHWNILLYLFAYGIILHLGGGKYSLTYYLEYRNFQKNK
jgi:putative oxidoreductase